jgi:hypothetical protein
MMASHNVGLPVAAAFGLTKGFALDEPFPTLSEYWGLVYPPFLWSLTKSPR